MNNILRNFSAKAALYLTVAVLALVATGCEKDHTDAVSGSEEIVLLTPDSQVYPLTINATKADWTASCAENWLTLSQTEGIGTKDITVTVLQNTSSTSRTATILVKMRNGANAKIVVQQQGLSDTEVRIAPEMITAKQYFKAPKYTFTLQIQHQVADPANDITAAIEYLGDVNGWISDLNYTDIPNSSYHMTRIYSFATADNTLSDAREAEITVTVKYSHNTYTRTVKVYQNGLGSPAVATPENVYMRHNQTEYKQTLWLNDGDATNVTYQVLATSSQSGTGTTAGAADGGWITKAEVVKENNTDLLKITAAVNTVSEVREGDIYIIASRSNNNNPYAATAKLRVHVTQAAHKAAGISLPVSELVHTYIANTDPLKSAAYTLPIEVLNNSKITATTDAAWVHIDATTFDKNILTYRLDQYTGGETGNFREAIVKITASNGNANQAAYYITVRQYAPEMPGISLPTSKVTHSYAANNGAGDTPYTLPLQTLNSAKLTASSNADWITIIPEADGSIGNLLKYNLSKFAGGEAGNTREGIISIIATNDHSQKAMYYITVCQYAPEMPGISALPEYIGLDYTAQSGSLPLNISDKAKVSVVGKPAWVTVTGADGSGYITTLSYTVTAYTSTIGDTNQADYFREGVISLKVTNDNAEAAYYYIMVRQYGRSLAWLDKASVGWSWNAVCIGSNTFGGLTNYTPAYGTQQYIQMNNIPGPATVTMTPSNSNFTITAYSGYIWSIVPNWWGTQSISDDARGVTIYFEVNAAPYIQLLTASASASQTVIHNH